ncbi:MAG: hypothetical protein HC824_07515 [Synechococcales cyanobacterium RM1_1_8]|nr:hypothetical protein [Synechococcales cyanobacterium RM1_1_8]
MAHPMGDRLPNREPDRPWDCMSHLIPHRLFTPTTRRRRRSPGLEKGENRGWRCCEGSMKKRKD